MSVAAAPAVEEAPNMSAILIVDDSEVVRQELGKVLVAAGYTVIYGADGAEGLALAARHTALSLVITDYNMPQMDGLTMLRRIREQPQHQTLRSFMLTTESSVALKQISKEQGVVAWIIKPCLPDKVLAAIRKVLGA